MSRSKDRGTAFETAVVKWLRGNGFPQAERLALRGRQDIGDVRPCPGFIIECKAHATVTDGLVRGWLIDTMREMDNAHADVALLVLKRPRKAVQDSWAWVLVRGEQPRCTWLADAVFELRYCGWGTSLIGEVDNEDQACGE